MSSHAPRFLPRLALLLRAMRVHQWSKNVLVFVPMLTAHRASDWELWKCSCMAFLCFSLCASGAYLINDVIDLQVDQRDPIDRNRPFASRALNCRFGIFIAGMLMIGGLGLSLIVSLGLFQTLVCYGLLTTAYTIYLKRVLLLDVFLLALFYTLRLIGGGAATGITLSFWLICSAIFMFLSLALVKRSSALFSRSPEEDTEVTSAGGYNRADLPQLAVVGTSSGVASVVVLAFYINHPDVAQLYRHPNYLWTVCFTVLFWINRVWILTRRNCINHDPILFALQDVPSYAMLALMIAGLVLAM
jgi:4-hydroxybenzoate polyprenyltransferase